MGTFRLTFSLYARLVLPVCSYYKLLKSQLYESNMEQDTDAYMLLQGACVTVKQQFHLNNFIIKIYW